MKILLLLTLLTNTGVPLYQNKPIKFFDTVEDCYLYIETQMNNPQYQKDGRVRNIIIEDYVEVAECKELK